MDMKKVIKKITGYKDVTNNKELENDYTHVIYDKEFYLKKENEMKSLGEEHIKTKEQYDENLKNINKKINEKINDLKEKANKKIKEIKEKFEKEERLNKNCKRKS